MHASLIRTSLSINVQRDTGRLGAKKRGTGNAKIESVSSTPAFTVPRFRTLLVHGSGRRSNLNPFLTSAKRLNLQCYVFMAIPAALARMAALSVFSQLNEPSAPGTRPK